MKWITRERVKVDRVACPWLIKKFIAPDAEFLLRPDRKCDGGRRTGKTPLRTT
ncbi:MAG TPA: chromate resistance protein ChrB domain-containing protein [Casimicrobiaceae bacterium]|nr:chromate resistance protein ChrB domain-containing protein [Casimicrobiaceae bacterium]